MSKISKPAVTIQPSNHENSSGHVGINPAADASAPGGRDRLDKLYQQIKAAEEFNRQMEEKDDNAHYQQSKSEQESEQIKNEKEQQRRKRALEEQAEEQRKQEGGLAAG